MNYSSHNFSSKRGFPVGNPLANALVIVVGGLVIGLSLVLGFFAFLILASVFIIFSAFVGIRLWWFNRKLRRRHGGPAGRSGSTSAGVIEGEYLVVEKTDVETRHDERG